MFRFPVLIVATLSWGALAFGAVYGWAYAPLLVNCAVLGVVGLVSRRRPAASIGAPLALALAAAGLVVVFQLLPLPRAALQRVSPSADALLRNYSFAYAKGLDAGAPIDIDALADVESSGDTSHPLSIEPQLTVVSVLFFVSLGVLLAGSVRVLTRQDIQTIVHGVIVLSVVVAFTGLVDRPTFNGKIYGFWQPRFVSSPFGPFANYNHFAGWMLMAIPLAIGCLCARVRRAAREVGPTWRDRLVWLASPKANQALLVAAATLVMALSLFLTRSRSGMTGFAVVVGVLGWLMLRHQAGGAHRFVVMGYLVVLAGLSIGWTGATVVFDRFSAVRGSNLASRIGVWQDTLAVIKDFPIAGTGLNTFGIAMSFYQRHDLNLGRYLQAHNDYLQLASEGGLLLAVPAIAALVLFARAVRQRFSDRHSDPTMYWLRVGAVTGLAAIALQEMVDFSLQIPGNAVLFTVLCAIALSGHTDRRVIDAHGQRHRWA